MSKMVGREMLKRKVTDISGSPGGVCSRDSLLGFVSFDVDVILPRLFVGSQGLVD